VDIILAGMYPLVAINTYLPKERKSEMTFAILWVCMVALAISMDLACTRSLTEIGGNPTEMEAEILHWDAYYRYGLPMDLLLMEVDD